MATSTEPRTRPTRAEIEPAALDVIRRRGAEILATARRYATTPEDAEDAYQRALEILLTKAPSTREDDLVPWLKTVVKHEAFALRKQREKHGVPSEHDELTPAHTDTHEHVERLDRLQRGAEALRRLKPAEMRCMLLLAEGHSYAEICAITGFSYTKVNRCLAEGRLSFTQRFAGIESGAECERLAPLISAAADGEADADDLLVLKRHLRNCMSCRKALREARSVPAQVAALAPVGVVADPGHLHSAWTWLHERMSSLALRGQELFEMAATHKTVVVAASAAAIAGGGAATVQTIEKPHHPKPHARVAVKRTLPVVKPQPVVRTPKRAKRHPAPRRRAAPAPKTVARAQAQATPTPLPPAPTPEPATAPPPATGEFGP